MWQIGHLLSKGISLMLSRQMQEREAAARSALKRLALEGDITEQAAGSCAPSELCDDSKAIVAYLKRVGPSMPVEIQRYAGIAKTTAFRRLRELQEAGIVRKTGSRKKVRYGVALSVVRKVLEGSRRMNRGALDEQDTVLGQNSGVSNAVPNPSVALDSTYQNT